MNRWIVTAVLALAGLVLGGSARGQNITPPAGGPPSGPAGGALSGTYPNPTIGPTIEPSQTVYSNPRCPSPNSGNCYFANWDAHYVYDASTTLNGSTITCPNSDCNFTGMDELGRPIAKVGQIAFVTSDKLNGVLTCPQSTISTINNANSITLAAANDCTGSALTGTGVLIWGDDDTSNLNAAWAATKCGALQMPGSGGTGPGGTSNALFQSALFTTSPSCVTVATFQGPNLYGGGVTSTFLIATPTFSWSSCTGGTDSLACAGGVINGHYQGFSIWGGGYNAGGTSGKVEYEVAGATRDENVDVIGWCATCAGVVGVEHNSVNGWFAEGGAIDAGTIACQSKALQTIWQGNACETAAVASGNTYAMQILSGASSTTIANGMIEGGTSSGTAFGLDCAGSCISIQDTLSYPTTGTNVAGFGVETNGTLYAYATLDDVSGAANTTGLYLVGTGGKAYLNNTIIHGGSSGQDIYMASSTDAVYDQGGNQFLGSTHVGNSGTGSLVADGHSVKGVCTGTATSSSTLGLYGTGSNETLSTCTSTTIGSGVVITGARSLLNLIVTATHAGVNASSGVVTVLKNGSATTITCTVGTGTSCSDAAHTVSVADGDLISIQFTTQASEVLAGVKAFVMWD